MAEYTYADIIMDPEDPRLEGAIGKECYLSDYPKEALDNARNDSMKYRLIRIEEKEICPFVDHEYEDNWSIVIIKKEEPKPKYVPFESIEEFLTAYFKSVANSECIQKTISSTGIWLKHNDAFLLVVEIWDEGVVVGDSKIKTIKNGDDEYFTMNDVTDWLELLRDYIFLDNTPCGKEVK